jgi:hypothetical protein
MEQDRVLGLRRNPHLAARTMLLKMHLVGCPQVHLRICHQCLEFLLCAFWRCGSACATRGAVSVNGVPIVEIVSDTGVPPGRPGDLHPESPTDPDVNLSIHPARVTPRKPAGFRQDQELPSQPGELRPELLTEPCVNLSTYTARATA